MTMKHLIILVLASCSTALSSYPPAASTVPQCSAGTPDDGLDDTAAVQNAIAAQCCLGPGVYDIDMAPTPPTGRRAYNMLTIAAGQELCGSGQLATMLRFRGDATGQDWRGVEMVGGSVHDLVIDTSALTGTSEQTHAIHATGPARGIAIYDVTISHPIRGAWPGGDCIDLVGYAPSQLITGVVVRDSVLAHCDRGGVQAHSGVVGLTVERTVFADTGDLDINSEGSGANATWTIVNNTFAASLNNQGATAIALDLVDGATVTGNVLARGVYLYSCTHCSIVANTIEQRSGVSTAAVIEAIKGSNDLLIAENTVTRDAAQRAGPVIHVGPHGTAQSRDVRIVHNVLDQRTDADVVFVEGMYGLRLDDNDVRYTGSAPNVFGIRALGSGGASGTVVERIALTGNRFTGALTSAVLISGAANRRGVGAVHAAWNTSDAPGLRCGELSGITGPLTLVYNAWPIGSCGVPSLAVTLP